MPSFSRAKKNCISGVAPVLRMATESLFVYSATGRFGHRYIVVTLVGLIGGWLVSAAGQDPAAVSEGGCLLYLGTYSPEYSRVLHTYSTYIQRGARV